MYYLFYRKDKDLTQYRAELDRVMASMREGRTPVYSEMRSAKTNLVESIPYNTIAAVFVVAFTLALSRLGLNEIVSLGVTLVANNFLGVLANYIFAVGKNRLRLRLCGRLGLPPTEEVIAAMESLEYQSV